MRLEVVGGPADGEAAAAARGFFRWIAPDGSGSSTPAPDRALYRRSGRRWMFTGFHAWVCSCGVLVVARARSCPLCSQSSEEGLGG